MFKEEGLQKYFDIYIHFLFKYLFIFDSNCLGFKKEKSGLVYKHKYTNKVSKKKPYRVNEIYLKLV